VRIAGPIAAGLLLAAPAAAAGDPERGETVFKRCVACHRIGEGAASAAGPVLTGVVGRPAGGVAGFDYSAALIEQRDAGLVWNEETLAAYLADPRGFIPGNRMVFGGLRTGEDIADVIAYLETFPQ
jgi:cytochrome c